MSPTLVKITHQNTLLAIIVRNRFQPDTHQFLTEPDSPLQLGVLSFEKGHRVAPHTHKSLTKTTHQNQEFLHLKSGQLKAKFYYQKKLVHETTLNPGDSLLQLSGGHAFEATQNTKLITIKQGPYHGQSEEKNLLSPIDEN